MTDLSKMSVDELFEKYNYLLNSRRIYRNIGEDVKVSEHTQELELIKQEIKRRCK